ncbi:MAG: DegT/DnrJ/EryC1/StrS family aminotransferase [Candidatus Omnitrophota bacterium]|nr:DegT/DnrJ/EryC1/StrS family aminotransferase [Candidatus Omnitrophota bacterium]
MKKIPILDLKAQIRPIRAEIDAAIKEVIDNTAFILGGKVSEFEDAVIKYTGAKYAVACSNGTDAISLALSALGIGASDGVVCPSFTFYATAGSIAALGAIPVFADIDPHTYTISVSSVEQALKQKNGPKIKAIMPVHLYGQCADMEPILKIARENQLKVIEDNAQAFGAEYLPAGQAGKGKKSGTIADCGSISFFPGKNLGAFGDAGMVLANDKAVADALCLLRNQGNKEKYHHLVIGHNNRMDTLQAAVLNVKLKYLDAWNNKRQQNAAYYNQGLKGLPIKTPLVAGYSTHIYHQYVLRLDRPSAGLIEHLINKGIDARVYYPLPLHLQPCFKYLGYKAGDFPESVKASHETLAIPVYPELSKEDMDYIIGAIKEYLM